MTSLSAVVFSLAILLNVPVIFTESTANIKLALRKIEDRYIFTSISNPILIENESFEIQIFTAVHSSYLTCKSELSGSTFYHGTMSSLLDHYYATIVKANPNMGGTWKCIIQTYEYVEVECTFPVHYRSKDVGEIYINNNEKKQKTALTTNLNVTEYDESGVYSYIDGEISEFTCKSEKPGEVTMIYYTGNREMKILGRNEDNPSMFIKLKSSLNGSYLDCQVNVPPYNDLSTTRIYLKKKSDIGFPTFKINDQILLPVHKNNVKDLYRYKYFDGERVNVTTVFEKFMYSTMEVVVKGHEVPEELWRDFKNPVNVTNINESIELRKENNMLRIECTLYMKYIKYSVDNIALDFIYYDEKNITDFNPVIIGLPWSNILLKYKKYHNLSYIFYEYKNNEMLKLTCLSNNITDVDWFYNGTKITSNVIEKKNTAKINYFRMNKNYKEATITCRANDSAIRLILTRKHNTNYSLDDEDVATENGVITDEDTTEDTTTTELASSENNNSGLAQYPDETNPGEGNRTMFIIIGVLVGLIIISIIMWMMVMIYKRRLKPDQSDASYINYENLPEHNNGPMPIPHQWQCRDEPTYASPRDMNIEAMYAKPIPKHLRNKEVSDPYAEAQYAEPYLGESPYAEVLPKQTDSANSEGNPSSHYANLEFETQNGSDKKFPKTEIYSEIIKDKKIMNKDDNYENTFEKERYENAHSERDSIEPAYCEINKIN